MGASPLRVRAHRQAGRRHLRSTTASRPARCATACGAGAGRGGASRSRPKARRLCCRIEPALPLRRRPALRDGAAGAGRGAARRHSRPARAARHTGRSGADRSGRDRAAAAGRGRARAARDRGDRSRKLAAEPMPPREMERAARTLTSLTRTLRELNELLSQYRRAQRRIAGRRIPDEFALELMRRLDAFKAAHAAADRRRRSAPRIIERAAGGVAGNGAPHEKRRRSCPRRPLSVCAIRLTSRWNCSPGSGSRYRPSRPAPSWRRSPRG